MPASNSFLRAVTLTCFLLPRLSLADGGAVERRRADSDEQDDEHHREAEGIPSGSTLLRKDEGLARPIRYASIEINPLAWSVGRERVGRGLYVPAKAGITEQHTLVEAAARSPNGIVCLLSALRFHGIGTQNPHEVWLAIDVKAWKPVADSPRTALPREARAGA